MSGGGKTPSVITAAANEKREMPGQVLARKKRIVLET